MPHIDHPLNWPSVTQILHDYDLAWLPFFYKKWKTYDAAKDYSEQAKERGTRIHAAFEMLLRNTPIDVAQQVVQSNEQMAVSALRDWLERHEVMSLAEERHVESKREKYHGSMDHELNILRTDWITTDFWRNPVPTETPLHCLSDLKTQEGREVKGNEIKKHAMQLAAYAYALEELTGQFINTGLVINVDIATGIVSPVVVHPLKVFLEPFMLQRKLWDYINSEESWQHLRIRKRAA